MISKEYIYPGAIQNMESILCELKVKNIFLVRGKQSYIKSGAKEILISLSNRFNIVEFSEFGVNPKQEEAQIGFDLFKGHNIDVIIAVGGGSVIDTAKFIKYLAIKEKLSNINIPFIAVPTTAGTGSEATHFAVVYMDGVKQSIAHMALIPTVAIVDANLMHGQSKYQLAVSGIDAFAQGIESFWSLNATENSLEYSEKAIKLMWENIYNAVNGHEDALVKIAEGSNWAGKAINISKTTAPHALSYYVTKEFNLPHGHAVALFLPYFFTYNFYLNSEKCLSNVKITNEDILIKLMQLLAVKDRCFIEKKIKDFVAQLGIENDFEKLNISKKEVIKILESANPERLKNNPRLFNVKNFIDETMILSY